MGLWIVSPVEAAERDVFQVCSELGLSINPRNPAGTSIRSLLTERFTWSKPSGPKASVLNQSTEPTLVRKARQVARAWQRIINLKHAPIIPAIALVFFIPAIALVFFVSANAAWAADHRVEMLNKDSEGRPMQFEPAFLRIEPGDTVTFVPTDKGHNSESIKELIPSEGAAWKGKINEEITVTFDQEGFYAYKCLPHVGLGMVGLIQVGPEAQPFDSASIEELPGRAKDRMAELVAQAAAQ